MSLGERLRKYLGDRAQKGVALDAVTRLEKGNEADGLSASGAPSRLSQLLNDDLPGVQAWFGRPARAAALLDALGVPEADREELLALASAKLARTRAPAALVVDLSDLEPSEIAPADLFAALKGLLERPAAPRPVALVLREDQFDGLPRSFDGLASVERVGDGASAAEVVARLGGDTSLVASRRRLAAWGSWIALDVARRRLEVEPPTVFRTPLGVGDLALPVAPHDLETLGVAPADPPELPARGTALRRMAVALASGTATMALSARLAAAQALGIRAGATVRDRESVERERTEAEVDGLVALLDRTPRRAEPTELERVLAEATRWPTTEALRVLDEVHLVNPTQPPPAHPRIHVHRIPCREPEFTRLEGEAAALTADDLILDRELDRLIERLVAEGAGERGRFEAARDLLLEHLVPGRGEAVDPLEALRRVVAQDPPAPGLLLESTPDEGGYSYLSDASLLVHRDLDAPFLVRSVRERARPSLDEWRRLVEARRTYAASGEGGTPSKWPPEPWESLDEVVATTWLALRAALATPVAAGWPGGGVLLALGGQIAARVTARRLVAPAVAVAAVRCRVTWPSSYRSDPSLEPPLRQVVTLRAQTQGYETRIGPRLPAMWLVGSDGAVDVDFVAAPLLPAGAGAAAIVAASSAASSAAAIRRRADDDDDD